MNDRLLRALAGEATDRRPLWVMRQAGRYLPEYRALRKEVDFLTATKTPELAAKLTLQPMERFELDAAIFFADIMTLGVPAPGWADAPTRYRSVMSSDRLCGRKKAECSRRGSTPNALPR